MAGFGTNTAALAATGGPGPSPPFTVNVEKWDGTSWTETSNVSTGRRQSAGAGTTSLGFVAGGDAAPVTTATEEFTAGVSTETVAVD